MDQCKVGRRLRSSKLLVHQRERWGCEFPGSLARITLCRSVGAQGASALVPCIVWTLTDGSLTCGLSTATVFGMLSAIAESCNAEADRPRFLLVNPEGQGSSFKLCLQMHPCSAGKSWSLTPIPRMSVGSVTRFSRRECGKGTCVTAEARSPEGLGLLPRTFSLPLVGTQPPRSGEGTGWSPP